MHGVSTRKLRCCWLLCCCAAFCALFGSSWLGDKLHYATVSPAGCCAQPARLNCHFPTAGSIYVLSGRVAADLAAMRDGALRHFANEGEGASMGSGGRRHSASSLSLCHSANSVLGENCAWA